MPIGPALPPHLAHLSASAQVAGSSTRSTTPPLPAEESDDDDDDYGPALPPHLAAARGSGPGPSRPPTKASPVRSAVYDDDEESDDDIGPKPPGAEDAGPEKSAVEEFVEREKRRAERLEEESKPKVLTRDEWMLVPPEAGIMSNCMSPFLIHDTQALTRQWIR